MVGLYILSVAAMARAEAFDIRGVWEGKAQGSIFGAEGSVNIIRQEGDTIFGVVEGGNFFGKARFTISGKIHGNQIVGEKAGNVFRGALYSDGAIRGAMKTVDGDIYQVFLRRPYNYWYQYHYPR